VTGTSVISHITTVRLTRKRDREMGVRLNSALEYWAKGLKDY